MEQLGVLKNSTCPWLKLTPQQQILLKQQRMLQEQERTRIMEQQLVQDLIQEQLEEQREAEDVAEVSCPTGQVSIEDRGLSTNQDSKINHEQDQMVIEVEPLTSDHTSSPAVVSELSQDQFTFTGADQSTSTSNAPTNSPGRAVSQPSTLPFPEKMKYAKLRIPDNFPPILARILLGPMLFATTQQLEDASDEQTTDGDSSQKDSAKKKKAKHGRGPRSGASSVFSNLEIDLMGNGLEDDAAHIEEKLGYRFQDLSNLQEALTHCSVQHQRNNQRLEFLGDAVLDMAVATILYSRFGYTNQGILSASKSDVVNNKNLAGISLKFELYKHMTVNSVSLRNEFYDIQVWRDAEKEKETNAKIKFAVSKRVHHQQQERKALAKLHDQAATIDLDEEAAVAAAVAAVAAAAANFVEGSNSNDGIDSSRPDASSAATAATAGATATPADNVIPVEETVNVISVSAAGALADLFEALIGAIFLDCHGNLEVIKSVILKVGLLPPE
jgi:dsRNA-specific ribonuclease